MDQLNNVRNVSGTQVDYTAPLEPAYLERFKRIRRRWFGIRFDSTKHATPCTVLETHRHINTQKIITEATTKK